MTSKQRSLVARAGLVALATVFASGSVACIFDQGDYKGTGRGLVTATAKGSGTDTEPPPPPNTPPPNPPPPNPPPPADAGGG